MLDPKQIVKETKESTITPNIPTDYTIRQTFHDDIKYIGAMTDEEIYNLQCKHMHYILSGEEPDVMLSLLRNPRFITTFNNAIKSMSKITGAEAIVCNSYLAELLFSSSSKYMRDLYFIAAETMNRFKAVMFEELGVSPHTSIYLALACWSTTEISESLKQLNDIITFNFDSSFMTIQKIIDIYSLLYRNNLTDLVLTNTFDTRIKKLIPTGRCNRDAIEIENNIRLSTLYILDSVPVPDIVEILYLVSETYFISHNRNGSHARIKYHNLPSSIRKIPILVEHLEYTEDNFKLP